jgi:ATP-dependent helicase Lhr and Lhr-like helicase
VRALRVRRGSGRGSNGRGRPGRLARLGPPTAQGRWSSTRHLLDLDPLTDAAAARHRATLRRAALADQLLERHGVLTREALRVEAVDGGFAAVYPVLKAAEEAGTVRRGYLVAGLGAAQFAHSGAVERLRAEREREDEAPEVVLLAATDPAQPYGAALAWPDSAGRPARSAGAYVVLVDGTPAGLLERGGRSLVTFTHPAEPSIWLGVLTSLVDEGRLRKLELTKIDGTAVHDAAPWPAALDAAGFTAGYRGMTYRGRGSAPVGSSPTRAATSR